MFNVLLACIFVHLLPPDTNTVRHFICASTKTKWLTFFFNVWTKKKSYNMMFIIKQPLRNHNCNVFKLGSIKKPVWMLFHYFYLSNIKTLYTLSRKSLHISQKKQSYWVVLNRAFRSWRSDPCDIFKTWPLLMIPVVVKVLQRRDFFLTAGSVTHRPRCKWVDWVNSGHDPN